MDSGAYLLCYLRRSRERHEALMILFGNSDCSTCIRIRALIVSKYRDIQLLTGSDNSLNVGSYRTVCYGDRAQLRGIVVVDGLEFLPAASSCCDSNNWARWVYRV